MFINIENHLIDQRNNFGRSLRTLEFNCNGRSLRTLESAAMIESKRTRELYIMLTLIVSNIDNRFRVKEYAVVYYRKIERKM